MMLRIKNRLQILILLSVLPFAGCYSKSFQEPVVRDAEKFNVDRTFRASFNSTWNAVLKVLEDAPIARARKESGVILTDWIISKSDRLFSGYGPNKIPYKIHYKFLIRLRPGKKGTSVSIENKEQYYTDAVSSGSEFKGSLYQWVDTTSSTAKEKQLLDLVEVALEKESK
jgi:uncharacterized lipoprotein